MSLCREPFLALRSEENAGGSAGSWLPQEDLSACIDITVSLRSNSIDLQGKKARNDEEKAFYESPTHPGNKKRYTESCYHVPALVLSPTMLLPAQIAVCHAHTTFFG